MSEILKRHDPSATLALFERVRMVPRRNVFTALVGRTLPRGRWHGFLSCGCLTTALLIAANPDQDPDTLAGLTRFHGLSWDAFARAIAALMGLDHEYVKGLIQGWDGRPPASRAIPVERALGYRDGLASWLSVVPYVPRDF
jgi:hypothetical protein